MAAKHTGRIAFVGILTALALVFLLLTAAPVTTVGLAALAGLCGIPVVVELGKKAGLLHYAAVGILSLLLVPAMEGKAMYIAFFGYYTVLKAWLEGKRLSRPLEWTIKLAVFLVVLVGAGVVLWTVVKPPLPDWFAPGWMLPVAALLLCGVFIVYDWCLTGLVGMYMTRLHPALRRVFRF